jgi:hypothetical protein
LFYLFLLICGALALAVYVVFIMKLVPGAAEERLGVLEPLAADVGKWKEDLDSDEGKSAKAEGLVREVRQFFYESNGRLVHQVRYRDPSSGEIVRTEPERNVKRKRVRS